MLQFTAYVGNFVKVRQLNELLQSTDVVGTIRFSRPTLYIFPGCQGDSALFGISGFNLLVNGGFSRRACFWDFTRHLDRIDAALMTHLGTDNLYGLSAVLERKAAENVHPEIGFMYLNVSDKLKAVQEGDNEDKKESSLMVNLANEGNKIVEYAKQIGQFPHPCSRSQSGQTVEPINLFHKVGIGSLDMYILNPITDSKELKEFYQQWNQKVAQFGLQQHVPLPNTLSVCALLVWRPSSPNDNITRIFFPGNAPQHKVMEGLEKLKHLDILKHAQCTKTSLSVKPAAKKPSLGSKPPVARSKVSPVQTPKQEVPKKEIQKTETKAPPKPRPASAPKTKKEIINKKTSKENEKTDKTKSSTSSSPSKASTKSATPTTPKEIVSPVAEPEKVVPVKEPVKETVKEPEPAPAPEPLVDVAPKSEPAVSGTADLLGLDSSVDPPGLVDTMEPAAPKHEDLGPAFSDSPAPLPNPVYEREPEQAVPPSALDKAQLLEMGVYDEDQDIEQHLNAQPQPNDKVSQMFGGMTDSMHEDLQPAMSDLMTTSMHESMYDDRDQFGEQPQPQNGLVLTPDDEDSEEIQPQALPEPMAYAPASYSQEPDLIPNTPTKESSVISEPEVATSAVEPDLLPLKQEEEFDEQSTAKIEDELSATNEIDDQHFDEKEIESPDEVSSKLPLDEQVLAVPVEEEKPLSGDKLPIDEQVLAAPVEEEKPLSGDKLPLDEQVLAPPVEGEKHLSEDEGFDQDHFKEDDVEEKDVTEDSEKADIIKEQETQSFASETARKVPESDLNVMQDDEVKTAPLPESVIEPKESDSNKLNLDRMEEEEVLPAKSDLIEAPFKPEPVKETDLDSLPVVSDSRGLDMNDESDELEQIQYQKHDPALESPNVSPIEDIDTKEQTRGFESKTEEMEFRTEEVGQSQHEPQEPTDSILLQRTESPIDEIHQQTFEDDHEDLGQERESPDIMLEPEQTVQETFESREQDLTESQELTGSVAPDIIERPRTPEPEEIEVEHGDKEAEDFSHEGTPDSIEEQQKEDMIENDFVGTEEVSGQGQDVHDADEEKENVQPLMENVSEQQLVDEIRDSLEREPIPVPSDFQDDQRDSIEREEEEEEEDDDEDEESSEEEESQSQSTSYEEEEASDQKCLIQDSVSEDHKVVKAGEADSGAAGHVDSLGVDSQPSDSLVTPESEMTDHSPGFAMDYHQMGEQEEPFEGADHLVSMPASNQAYPAPQDFSQYPVEPSGYSSNPFDLDYQPGGNQFMGMDTQPIQPQQENPFDNSSDDEQAPGGPASFDPLAEWGQPMGLPSPSPADTKANGATSDKKSPKDKGAKPGELKKPDAKKAPSSAGKTKTAPPATKAPKASNGVPEKSKSRLSGVGTSNPSRLSTGGTANSLNTSRSTDKKTTTSKPRPATAPVKDKADTKATTNGTKRPATATGKSSAASATKMPPLPAFTPFYVDLTYIPNHGNPQYSDVEFFKRIRARYYVLSSLSPNPQVLDALIEAKKTWEDKELAVTIIPTYDNETLRHWMGLHKETLSDMKVEVAPSASRCTIQLQDHETSSSAYRLEF